MEIIAIIAGLVAVGLLAWYLGKKDQQAKQSKEVEVARQKMDKVNDFSKSDTTNSLRDDSF